MNTHQTPVLISGAGPTGLMMACQLVRFGVDFRIIDKKTGPSGQSKALGVQARTLEAFEQMGLAEQAVKLGKKATTVNFIAAGKRAAKVPLLDMGKELSQYPYLLILEQDKTEQLLIDYLHEHGKNVEWETALKDFQQQKDGVQAVLSGENSEETVFAEWLVGADGAASTTRKKLELPFEGGTYEQVFLLADVLVDWGFEYNELYVCMSHSGFAAFFPMSGGQRYRAISSFHEKELNKKIEVSFEEVRAVVQKNAGVRVDINDPKWVSVYRLHHRGVRQFRKKRCFLAGDAAHIHSPAGAQGMNTGIQDAWNLAWKLALVIKDKARPEILETYHHERYPFSRKLLKSTDRAFQLVVSNNIFLKYFRLYLLPHFFKLVMNLSATRRFVFKTVSQINIRYGENLLNEINGKGFNALTTPGKRFPYIELNFRGSCINAQQFFHEPVFHLLAFHYRKDFPETALVEKALQPWSSLIASHHINRNEANDLVFEKLGITENSFLLVRPDGYVGFQCGAPVSDQIKVYLQRFLK